MRTFELNEGDAALMFIRRDDGSYQVKSLLNFGNVDPTDDDAMSEAFYYAAMVRGLAYIAHSDPELAIEAGIEYMRKEAETQP